MPSRSLIGDFLLTVSFPRCTVFDNATYEFETIWQAHEKTGRPFTLCVREIALTPKYPPLTNFVLYSLSDDLSRKLVQLQSEMELSTLYDDEQLRRSGESPSALWLPCSAKLSLSLSLQSCPGHCRPSLWNTAASTPSSHVSRTRTSTRCSLHTSPPTSSTRTVSTQARSNSSSICGNCSRGMGRPSPFAERVIFRAFPSQGTFFHGPSPLLLLFVHYVDFSAVRNRLYAYIAPGVL